MRPDLSNEISLSQHPPSSNHTIVEHPVTTMAEGESAAKQTGVQLDQLTLDAIIEGVSQRILQASTSCGTDREAPPERDRSTGKHDNQLLPLLLYNPSPPCSGVIQKRKTRSGSGKAKPCSVAIENQGCSGAQQRTEYPICEQVGQ